MNTYQIYLLSLLFVWIHCGLKDAGIDQGHAPEFPIRPEVDEEELDLKEIKWKDGQPLLHPCASRCEEGTRWNVLLLISTSWTSLGPTQTRFVCSLQV